MAQAIDTASLCVDRMGQLIMLDAALNRGALTVDALDDFTVTSASSIAWLKTHADPLAESPIETIARLSLATLKLEVAPQVELPGVGRVDFLVNNAVIVEMDGRAHHTDFGAFARDRERDRAAAALGLTVLRFTYLDAVTRPDTIAADVSAAIMARNRRC